MNTKYSEVFINAWDTVLKSFSTKQIISADVQMPDAGSKNADIMIIIGIIGDIDGQIVMSMDAETGKMLASEMLGGMEISEVDELVFSAVGELCNMIMGNACSSISSDNTIVDITPPTIVAEMSQIENKPLYNISFWLEDMQAIDFKFAVLDVS